MGSHEQATTNSGTLSSKIKAMFLTPLRTPINGQLPRLLNIKPECGATRINILLATPPQADSLIARGCSYGAVTAQVP